MNSVSHILHTLSYMSLPLLFAMVLHEYAHGWVAQYYGDPTAQMQGILTLNPLAHIDPLGTVILPLPIDPSRLHNPRQNMALLAAAGPGMNLLLAVASAGLFAVLLKIDPSLLGYWSEAIAGSVLTTATSFGTGIPQ